MNPTDTTAQSEGNPRASRWRNRALTVAALATLTGAGTVAVPPWAHAEHDNSDVFAKWCERWSPWVCDHPVAPKSDSAEFDSLLFDLCDKHGGGTAEPASYTWHHRMPQVSEEVATASYSWALYRVWQQVGADGCEFIPSGEPDVYTGREPRPYRNDRQEFTRNCSQEPGANISTNYQDTDVSLYTVGTSVSVGGESGLFGLAKIKWEVSFNYSYQWGTWTWKGQTFDVPPGYVGWLESTEDWGVIKGRYKLNFPHPLRGHYIWYTPETTVEAPLKGSGTTNYHTRKMTDAEIRQMCPNWDWDDPDPRGGDDDEEEGAGGSQPPDCETGPADTPSDQPTSTGPGGTSTPIPTETGNSRPPEWAPGQDYELGDRVTYAGHTYQCVRAHVSDSGWRPPRTPDLWRRLT